MFRKLLAVALLLFPTLAHADWHEATSKHFIVYSDESPEKLRTFTERLERFDQTLRHLTGTADKPLSPNLRVTVFVVSDVDQIQKLAGSRSVAGFFIPRASGSMAFVPRRDGGGQLDAQTILLHEYGHSFMFSAWPSAVFPPWFVEGFAEFVGTAVFRADGNLLIGKAPMYREYGVLRSANVPASRLLALNPGKLEDLDGQTFYGRSWLLAHYGILGGHARELGAYIELVNAGKIDEANKVFGPVGALDGKLNTYARKPAFASLIISAKQVPIGEVTMREVTPGEAATMPARIISSRGVNNETAPEVAALARRLAAPYPNDSAAQNVLAEAEFDAKNYAAAEAAADRALAVDPKSIHALLYKGMAQMEVAKTAKNKDPAHWKAIRAWFVKANKLDTEYPQPLILYYESFEAAEQPAPQAAQDSLLGAYVLAPYDDGLRLTAGKVLLQQKNVPAARIAFEKVAYGPHQEGPNVAMEVVKALDEKGPEAALAAIAEAKAKAKEAEEKKKRKG
jgi:tetratricopeptide (TPR) repeat protein